MAPKPCPISKSWPNISSRPGCRSENPGAPAGPDQPALYQIDFGIGICRPAAGDAEHFEVEIKLRVTAKAEEKPLFLLELAYAGLFRLVNIPEPALQQVLLIQAPFMLFPFARRIVADVVRDGGMPPLMIEPIDFVALYQNKMAQGQVNTVGNALISRAHRAIGSNLPSVPLFHKATYRPVPWRQRPHVRRQFLWR